MSRRGRLQAVKLKWCCDTAAGKMKTRSKLDNSCRVDEAVLKPVLAILYHHSPPGAGMIFFLFHEKN